MHLQRNKRIGQTLAFVFAKLGVEREGEVVVHVTWSDGTGLAIIGLPCGSGYRHLPSYPHHLSLQVDMPPNREPMWYCHEVSLSSDLMPLTVLISGSLSAGLKCVHSWYVYYVDNLT